MRRRPPILTPLSAVACVAIVALECRSLVARDRVALPLAGHYYAVTLFPHHLYVDRDAGWPGMRGSFAFGLPQYPATPRYLELRLVSRYAGAGSLAVPLWLPLLPAAALPLARLTQALRRRRRLASGACSGCGYDLRATPGRCPECGGIGVESAER